MTLLNVKNLTVGYESHDEYVHAVNNVSLDLKKGEVLGVVGESGCGKSTLGRAILQLLPENGSVEHGTVSLGDTNLTGCSKHKLNQEIRWKEMAWIPQSAMNALNPTIRVENILRESLYVHKNIKKQKVDEQIDSIVNQVDLDDSILSKYPHELSGGQRQRVIIALSLLLDPELIVADEPTTGLDVIVQDGILDLIDKKQNELNNSVIFISHDINAVKKVSDRIAVMYGGEIVEIAEVDDLFEQPSHPYTIGLKNSFPTINNESKQLISMQGKPPDLSSPPSGCNFADRCPFSTEECTTRDPENHAVAERHLTKCHYPDQDEEFREQGSNPKRWENSDG